MTTGLYIQIPFCASKCSFCNFSSRVERAEVYAEYAQALLREIDHYPDIAALAGIDRSICNSQIDSIYIGGGTPAVLGSHRLAEIVAALKRRLHFAPAIEFTLEATPGSADYKFLRHARAIGINRLSIGAQTFDDRELRAVGRLHSADDTRALVRDARQQGIENISLDLIAGLPFQTADSWQASLEAVRELMPVHVSVYIFEIDEKSRLGREVLRHGSHYHASDVPSEDFMADAYESAREFLAAAGYAQYEISNFALPGCESRHNQKYWRLEPYIGLGAGSHSFDGSHRWSNVVEPHAYAHQLSGGNSPVEDFRRISDQEQLEEFFFLGLRQTEGVDLEAACERWGFEQVARWEPVIARLKREGWLEQNLKRICVPQRAFLVSNEIFQEFLVA